MTSAPARREPRNVPALLARLRPERFTGAVAVSGGPGGTLHLRDGLVGAVQTPAAPTAESVLLRSGRIAEGDWTTARAARPDAGPLADTLVAGGFIGAAELELVCTAAVFDGAFAMALNPVDGFEVLAGHPAPELTAAPGVEPARLTEETARRLAALRDRGMRAGDVVGAPVRLVVGARPQILDARRHALLLGVDGRRTPRDLAFALGRGVFPVLLDLVRLHTVRLTESGAPPERTAPPVSVRARPRPAATDQATVGPLPRRRPPRHSGPADRSRPQND
ncbi:hypothetical protein [Actinacidiphila sp. ITFR-21]|uniref:hypothetical protein n=1 Tax=Actinacidiphila sp. ITFR-21 TaxID=3075199 RepID=UPI00288BC89C|nr:hypothetical protein [Streptomyces sp. ITFR-21]WNI14386.1 hypothetical protein RLT57_01755 [Streptomyces sp. ITFR-21]